VAFDEPKNEEISYVKYYYKKYNKAVNFFVELKVYWEKK
jgi:hypothetical protein